MYVPLHKSNMMKILNSWNLKRTGHLVKMKFFLEFIVPLILFTMGNYWSSSWENIQIWMSRLQLFTTKFEILKMLKDETVVEFNVRFTNIVNNSFVLGENMTNKNLVRKIIISLPKRFDMNVTAIEESQNVSTLKFDEYIGFFHTFKIPLILNSRRRVNE